MSKFTSIPEEIKSFLREWMPEKFEMTSSFSPHHQKIKESKLPLTAIEMGVAGMTLRGVANPIIKNQEYLGSVEIIQSFNSIVSSKKDLGASVVFNR